MTTKPKPKKPVQIRLVGLEGKIVGAIFRDATGYFYRPKRNSITVGPHSTKWDGDHYPTQKECERTL